MPTLHPSRAVRARLVPLLFGALFAVAASSAGAADSGVSKAAPLPVAVAEVSSQAKAARIENVPDLLRKDLEAELPALDWSKARTRKRYLLSATVVELGSAPSGPRSVQSSCVVSATVRDAEKGNVLAILQGKARVEEEASSAAATERALLSAAARSAIAKVPEAIAAYQ